MTSASGRSESADHASIEFQRGQPGRIAGGLSLDASPRGAWRATRAAAIPTAMCPMLAISDRDHGRQNGLTKAPFPAVSQTATRAHVQPLALAFHSNRLLANSRVEVSSIT